MEPSFLFVNLSNEDDKKPTPDLISDYNKDFLMNSDKENLIRVINTLIATNDALRKYIHLLENQK